MRVDLFLESKVSSDHSSHKGFTGSHALSTDQTQIPSGVTSVDVVPSCMESLEPTKYWAIWTEKGKHHLTFYDDDGSEAIAAYTTERLAWEDAFSALMEDKQGDEAPKEMTLDTLFEVARLRNLDGVSIYDGCEHKDIRI